MAGDFTVRIHLVGGAMLIEKRETKTWTFDGIANAIEEELEGGFVHLAREGRKDQWANTIVPRASILFIEVIEPDPEVEQING